MIARRSRQRGHMDVGLVGWLIQWLPLMTMGIFLVFALAAWCILRNRK